MKKINLLLALLVVFSIISCGQTKGPAAVTENSDLVNHKSLIGKWYSEEDSNFVLVFDTSRYTEFYGVDTTDKKNYLL